MQIGLAQVNPIVGDLAGNCAKICEITQLAAARGAELVVFPELVVCGYPPKDFLLRSGFVAACDAAVEHLAAKIPANIGILVGHPTLRSQPPGCQGNAASLLFQGKIQATICKQLLPNYDVFDERRYFHPAEQISPLPFQNLKLGVHICEDAWFGQPDTFYHFQPACLADPVAELMKQQVDLLINLSASPFEVNKQQRRIDLMAAHCRQGQVGCLFVNQTGGNDDLVFDGSSFVLNARGELTHQLDSFQEQLQLIDYPLAGSVIPVELPERAVQLKQALIVGLQDYAWKSGFREAVLGLSGGIDSAVACCLAAAALGPENVHAIMMPSRYSSEHSVTDSQKLVATLGIPAELIEIDTVHQSYEHLPVIGNDLQSQPAGLADQNLQARIRGAIVMVRSNRHGWLPLATGNKSELAVGYCTLYGDMAGGFAVLCDVLKRDVYAIARLFNTEAGTEIIPLNIISKAPSAELAPNQFDQDSLPPYEILDGILAGLIEEERSAAEMSAIYPAETVQWVLQKLDRNEFKRRQMPPGIKLTRRAFGSGRRMPMAARYTHSDQ